MITTEDKAAAEAFVASIRTPGLRIVCSYCGTELPGSDPAGKNLSHGMCRPLCAPAKVMGWGEILKDRWILFFRGQPVRFDPIDARRVFSLVDETTATTFSTLASAEATLRAYGLPVKECEIRKLTKT